MRHGPPIAVSVAVTVCCCAAAEDAARLRLVPFPRQIGVRKGTFDLKRPLVLEAPEAALPLLGGLIEQECRLAGLQPPRTQALPKGQRFVRLSPKPGGPPPQVVFDEKMTPGGYVLEVGAEVIVCAAPGEEGLFHGVQTLRQLLRANRVEAAALPCVAIRDWPALGWRCFQDDLTRGPSSRLATMKRDVDLGALLKMNVWTYYMEYQYAFRKHPKIGPRDGSLTPADLRALVDYARPRHVAVMGNQQSFGHFTHILKHDEYADLRETGYLLTPANEKTYRLLDDLYSEVIPLLPFEYFNVCCDETWGLGRGPAKALADEIGVGGVYVRHIRRVHDLVKGKYGKRMMMWGDIILQHPKHLDKIPKDVVMLTWGYGAADSFEKQIIPFAKSGYEFFVCPGVSNWSRILPDFGVATTNIRHFVRDGVKHGAAGMLNTAWEDDGEALNAPKWHGHAWAAECAWTGSRTTPADFNRRIGAVLFGEESDRFGKAIELLAQAHRMPGMMGMNNRRFWQDDFGPKRGRKAVAASARRLLEAVQPAIEHLRACRKEAKANAEMLDYFLHGAMRMERIGLRMLAGLEAAELYGQACDAPREKAAALVAKVEAIVRRNRDATSALGKEFRRLWLAESKPYALDRTMGRYAVAVKRYGDLADQLAAARKALAAGKPLPEPSQLGLALPKPLARRTRPDKKIDQPLRPKAPWAEPDAASRLGLTVHAGNVDRHDLPIELDMALPAGAAGKPVRTFRLSAGAEPREIPAQLDAAANKSQARLVLVLPGRLAKGSTAEVHVYAGLPKPPARLASAASTKAGPGGGRWLANNKVRLLLGTEGAHVYRWEVAAAGGRDLTMPGTTGWAGFSDMARGYRSVRFRLQRAAAGPAMVRYRCVAPNGMVKTVSLYAGASWLDVLLSEPTGHYWDIDNPKNFAADGSNPGRYVFSNGKAGPIGREADRVAAQVRMKNVRWAVKHNADRLALGLTTPETPAAFRVAPGAGAGGVGIEASPAAGHFVTFAGVLEATPAETMQRLRQTLDLKNQPTVTLHETQSRGPDADER